MSTAAIRKRPASDQEPPRVDGGGKKPRYSFGSICDYEMLKVLGGGAHGVAFKARDRRTGRKVAIKWFRGRDLRAITREAGLLAGCRGHPSIIEILDVAKDADTGDLYLVTELVGGGLTLRENIWRPLPEGVVKRMMRLLLNAAKKIHGAGIVHRDLKPENVLVSMFGDLKVCDFGYGVCYLYLRRAGRDGWAPEWVQVAEPGPSAGEKPTTFYFDAPLPDAVWYGHNRCPKDKAQAKAQRTAAAPTNTSSATAASPLA